MEADGTLPSSSSKPVKQAKKSGNRPSLADILQVQEEIRKGKARTKAQFQVEIPKPLAADLRAIEKVFTAELEGFVSYFEQVDVPQTTTQQEPRNVATDRQYYD
ncbi:hypothetical protein ABG067_006682 [Albugo candida]